MNYDVLVIGGGPAGYYCALNCARGDLKTALIEKEELGGTGLRWGCLPVKKMLDEIRKTEEIKRFSSNKGITLSFEDNFYEDLFKNTSEDLKYVEERISKELKNNSVDIYFGDGAFKDKYTFTINDKDIKAKNIIIATGTSPSAFGNTVLDGEVVITHKEAVKIEKLPRSIAIIGGNVEGIEFASLFSNMGVEVSVIEMEDEILKGNDRELVSLLEEKLINKGVKIYTGTSAKEVIKQKDSGKVLLEDGMVIEAEKVLVTGLRKPNFPRNIEKIGVEIEKHKIPVDKNLKTNISHIYAVGDINGILGMAHIAIQQGILVRDNILKNKDIPQNYKSLPRAIYTIPEIAGAGAQEWELKENNIEYRVERHNLKDSWRGFSKDIEDGFVKILIGKNDELLGVWMCGDNVSELVGFSGILVDNEINIEELKQNLFVHPTLSESILEAVLKF